MLFSITQETFLRTDPTAGYKEISAQTILPNDNAIKLENNKKEGLKK